MSEPTKVRQKVKTSWFGFWAGAFIFLCFLHFIEDARGMSALDAVMQAINPAWVPEIERS